MRLGTTRSPQVLAATLAIKDESYRASTLRALMPQLTGVLLEQGLDVALNINDKWHRATVLAALAPRLTGEAQEQALTQGLAAALAINDESNQAEALIALAPQSAGKLLKLGLAAAQAIRNKGYQAQAMAAFLSSVADSQFWLRQIRRLMADHLYDDLSSLSLGHVLGFCSTAILFAPTVLGRTTLAAIARHIIEICQEWEWL